MKIVASRTQEDLTIVKSLPTYADIKLGALSLSARDAIQHALASEKRHLRKASKPLCLYLEIYLFLIKEQINEQDMLNESMLDIGRGFIGAICSERFVGIVADMRKLYTNAFICALKKINQFAQDFDDIWINKQLTSSAKCLVSAFESSQFDEERVWVLGGWWARNKNGIRFHLPLHPLYERMGRSFTQRFYDICASHTRGRAIGQLVAVPALINFISTKEDISEELLLDRTYIARFWREFLIEFSQTSYRNGQGIKPSTIISGWNNQFVPLVRDAMVPAGLFASPLGGYPNPRSRSTFGQSTNVSTENVVQVKTNLLTRIPLHLSDAEAVQTLFIQIRKDVNLITQWAEQEIRLTDECIKQRKRLESIGTPRMIQAIGTNTDGHKYVASASNPNALANAAATLKKYGYTPRGNKSLDIRLLYPSPLEETARELGLPVTGSIIPYLTILVAEHPAITTSFLENFQLYNASGVRIGLVRTDGGHYLVGDKPRRGSTDAEQHIHLSEKSLKAIEGLLELTEPVRTYMRKSGDDDWRYLLLSSGKGFGIPYRIKKLAPQMCFKERIRDIGAGIEKHCKLPLDEAISLAKRFSLGRLRTSAATLVYLETQSVRKMAEALGHKYFDPDLLSRYLPPAIQEFFQERWIRIFQNGILCEALKDSAYLLESTDFKTEAELDEFLSQHALKLLPQNSETPTTPNKNKEIAFGVDAGIFAVLLSIDSAVSNALMQNITPNPQAQHWATVTRALIGYLNTNGSDRVDIMEQLNIARGMADPSLVKAFVYE